MADNFLGEIRPAGFNFAPKGWALCNGQIIPISQNTALFALLGTQYGGDGKTTFALPDLQGRVPIGQGQGPGLEERVIGEQLGAENVTLQQLEMPAHSHGLQSSGQGTTGSPAYAATAPRKIYAASNDGVMGAAAISAAGGGQPHNNMQPTQFVTYIIALTGIFPQRP